MSSSTGSGRVVGECAGWAAEAVVEGDRGGEGEEAGLDAGRESVESAGAVSFQGEQVFAGLEDRFDPLPDRRELRAACCFVSASGPDDCRVELGGGLFELVSGVAFVADHEKMPGSVAAFEHV